jgi:hypothetical protein
MSAAATPGFGTLAFPILGRARQATEETRTPVVAATFVAATAIVVVVVAAVAAADLRGRWVEAVTWHPFSIDDAIAPRVLAGRMAPFSSRWVLH